MYSVYWTLKSVTFISFIWSVMSRERFLFLLAFILFIWMVISSIFLTEWNGKLWPTYWFGPYLLKKFFHIFILYMLLIKPLLRAIKKGIVAWHDNLSALISPSNMFVCLGFFIPLEDFSLIWRRHHYRWKAADFDICSALMAVEQWGIFSMPHLLWWGTRKSGTNYCTI